MTTLFCEVARKRLRSFFLALLFCAMAAAPLRSSSIVTGDLANYAILYTGAGGGQLSITNVTVNGNIGVGGTGAVAFSGPGTINGALNFVASNTGQFSNSNGSNIGPTSVSYGDSTGNLTMDFSQLFALSSGIFGGPGTTISSLGGTLNESSGLLETINGVASRVFNVTSYSATSSTVLTINGDGSGDPVVFNFTSGTGSVNLNGTVQFSGTGLTSADQVLWNFQSSGESISLNNNGQSAFVGTILAPNDSIALTDADLNGRVFGGDSSTMQIVSGDTIDMPTSVQPEPSSWSLMAVAVCGLSVVAIRRRRCANGLVSRN